jgi:hypothetical protein
MPEDERRVSPRHSAYLGAEIDVGEGPARAAITHDGSATGLLLLTRSDLEIGQTVKLSVFLVEGDSRTVTGRVVRQEPLNPDENTLWRTKVAVDLSEPDPELAKAFMALAEQQSRIYGGST